MDELAVCLRAWRDRLDPAELGLHRGSRRKARGLRREEVADLAGVSVNYLARLEQGRATHPSVSVLEPLARALRLTDEERIHLFRLAGHGPSCGSGGMRRHLTPGVQRVLDRLGDVPVLVCDAAWDVVALNPLATALLGEELHPSGERPNALWRHFTGQPSRIAFTPEARATFEASSVADLHASVGCHPHDPRLRELVDDLLAASPDFVRLWEARPMDVLAAARKTVVHPEVGPIELDCDTLTVQGSDLRIVVYTAAPGSDADSKLALLAAVGGQFTSAGTP